MASEFRTPLTGDDKAAELARQLQDIERSLHDLTSGEVDAITSPAGNSYRLLEAQARLLLSERDLRRVTTTQNAVLNALPAQVALIDERGLIVFVNDAWKRFATINGLQSPEFGIGCDYVALCDAVVGDEAADARHAVKLIRAALSSGSGENAFEYPCHTPRKQHWFRMTVTPLSSAEGGGAVVMHVEITARKLAEQSLQDSEQRFRAIVEVCPDIIFTCMNDRVSFVNPSCARLLHASDSAQIVGRASLDLFVPDDRQAVQAYLQRLQAQTTSHGLLEARVLALDGTDIPVEIAVAAYQVSGDVVYLMVCRDISERQSTAIAMRRANELFQAVVDATPDHVYVKDLQGRYLLGNTSLASFLGCSVRELFGGKTVPTLSAEDALAVHKSDQLVFETGQVQTIEFELTGSMGRRTLQANKVPYRDEHGTLIGLMGVTRDITAIRQSEAALRHSQSMLSAAGTLARIGAWVIDLSHNTIVWSDEVYKLHDMEPGVDISVEQAFSFIAAESVDELTKVFDECVRHGTPYDVESVFITAKGRRIWMRAIGQPVRDARGQICKVQGAVQDVSERKRSESEVQRLAHRLTSTLENLTQGFYTVDREWRFTYVNAKAEKLLGRRREELLNQSLWVNFPQSVDSEFWRRFHAASCDNVPAIFEALYAPWDRWFRVSAYPSEEGLAVYFSDVSAERAARQKLELLQASVANLNDIILITEAEPLQDPGPRIVFVNAAFERATGYSSGEVLGKSPRLLQGPDTDRSELMRIRDALQRREPVHAELVNYTKSGNSYWVEVDIVPFRLEGADYSHFVAVERDVTERKRAQDALRELNAELETRVVARTADLELARHEAEQATRAKSAFLAAMSHEIRTPMNGVLGMIEVLHQSSLKGHQVEMVDLIRESAFSLLTIIDDVLDFSKIEAGKLTIVKEPLNPTQLIENVCAMLDPLAVKASVQLSMFVDPRIPHSMLGDEVRLRQIVVNLASNAIKFSSGREAPGSVSIRTMLVERQADRTTFDLVVADNGIGMDQVTVKRLFRPFVQADSSTTRRYGGTGLGLAISNTLAELMGGEISVISAPNVGSTFTVRLCLDDGQGGDLHHGLKQLIANLSCRIVGRDNSLANDLRAYLEDADVAVTLSTDLDAAAVSVPGNGLSLWLILPNEPTRSPDDLRALVRSRPHEEIRFIVLGRGRRRRLRVESIDWMTIDVDAMSRGTLLEVIALAAGRIESARDAQGVITEPPVAPPRHEALAQGRLILVAEDNQTNRTVIQKQLQLLGLACEVVVNGREALKRWRSGEFALLLTDLHMPEMDGYELTRAVRSEESPGRRTPIIALTANALREEAVRCREADMDAYLTKPVRLEQMRETIETWLAKASSAKLPIPVVNLEALTALVGDDPAVIEEVLQAFRKSAAQARSELARAIGEGSLQIACDIAHRLKSGARAIGATCLADCCEEVETAAREGQLKVLQTLASNFVKELQAVDRFLDER